MLNLLSRAEEKSRLRGDALSCYIKRKEGGKMSLLHSYDDREYDLTLEAFGGGVVEDASFSHSL